MEAERVDLNRELGEFAIAKIKRKIISQQEMLVSACTMVLLAGAVSIGVGIYMFGDTKASDAALASLVVRKPFLTEAAFVMLLLGVFSFITGFLGTFAVVQESPCKFILVIAGTLEVMILSCIILFLNYKYYSEVKYVVAPIAYDSFIEDFQNKDEDRLTNVWYPLQHSMHCCGIYDFHDFLATLTQADKRRGVFDIVLPKACCVYDADDFEPQDYDKCKMMHPRFMNTEGCAVMIETAITQNCGLMMVTAFCMIAIEFPIFICMCKWYGKVKHTIIAEAQKDRAEEMKAAEASALKDIAPCEDGV